MGASVREQLRQAKYRSATYLAETHRFPFPAGAAMIRAAME
jgi:hypothetical protein